MDCSVPSRYGSSLAGRRARRWTCGVADIQRWYQKVVRATVSHSYDFCWILQYRMARLTYFTASPSLSSFSHLDRSARRSRKPSIGLSTTNKALSRSKCRSPTAIVSNLRASKYCSANTTLLTSAPIFKRLRRLWSCGRGIEGSKSTRERCSRWRRQPTGSPG